MTHLNLSTSVFTFIKDARLRYLVHLEEAGAEVHIIANPHESSNIASVYDSQLGNCPKRAALQRNKFAPSHPELAELDFNDLHRMRSGVITETDWIAALTYIQDTQGIWVVHAGVPMHGRTRGKVDAWLEVDNYDPIEIAEQVYPNVVVEFKRTDGGLKDSYLFQLCSYLYKSNDYTLGKLILDHRHMVEELTVVPYYDDESLHGSALLGWIVYDERGMKVKTLKLNELVNEINVHMIWMRDIQNTPADEPYNAFAKLYTLPEGITSPLSSWECHQNWVKSRGEARFRCPYAGYCFGIKDERFPVVNEKDGRKIASRLVVADDGREFRYMETNGDE